MRRLGPILALGCGLLAYAAASAQEDAGTRVSPSGSALPWLKLEELAATRDRPLFAMDRRPQPPSQAPAAVASPQESAKQRPDFVLKGVFSEGSSTFVLLEDSNTSETALVRAGEKLGEWQILVDSDRSVTLVGDGEQIKLEMFQETPGISK